MRRTQIESIVAKTDDLSVASVNLLNSLSQLEDANNQTFDVTKAIRGTDSSVSQLVARIAAVAGVVAEFDKTKNPDLVPQSVLNGLQQAIDDTIAASNELAKQVDGLRTAHGGLQAFNYTNFHAQTRNGNSHNMQGQFQALHNATETLLQKFFECLYILKPRASYSFQAAANTLSSVVGNASDLISELKKSSKKVSATEERMSTIQEEATSHLEELKRLKTDSDSDRKTIADYLSQATREKASIDAISDETAKLQNNVKVYQERFDKFQKQLNEREAAFTSGTAKLGDLIASFERQREDIHGLIARSEKMLSSATVAGLAANFSTMMNKLTTELRAARIAFYVGIAFMTLSAFPLLAFVVMPLAAPILNSVFPNLMLNATDFAPNPADNGWQYLGQVLARIAILLPAAWFVSFSAIRHSSLFRLREHYAYKYSMAVAVEGFKQQSPRYEQEIAALVLEQLAFNPADKLIPSKDVREGKFPSIAAYLLDRIRDRVEAKPPEKPE